MKSLLLSAAAMTVFLSACGKEPSPTGTPVPPSPPSAPATPKVVEPAAPAGAMSDADKQKAMEAARDSAKAAGRKGE